MLSSQHNRPIIPVWLPGKAARAVRAGAKLAPERAVGRRTWEELLADRLSSSSESRSRLPYRPTRRCNRRHDACRISHRTGAPRSDTGRRTAGAGSGPEGRARRRRGEEGDEASSRGWAFRLRGRPMHIDLHGLSSLEPASPGYRVIQARLSRWQSGCMPGNATRQMKGSWSQVSEPVVIWLKGGQCVAPLPGPLTAANWQGEGTWQRLVQP
jgi:hypothetical protein